MENLVTCKQRNQMQLVSSTSTNVRTQEGQEKGIILINEKDDSTDQHYNY
jgi:hypothetical protein